MKQWSITCKNSITPIHVSTFSQVLFNGLYVSGFGRYVN